MKVTRHSAISDLQGLSESTVKNLEAKGFTTLESLNEVGFARIAAIAPLRREQQVIYKAVIGAGIAVKFDKSEPISSIPIISPATIQKLQAEKLNLFGDFEGRKYNEIYIIVGYAAGKVLLLGLVLANVKVIFDKPDWTSNEWECFVRSAVNDGLLSWEDVAVMVCGELNPPQVGTAVANAVKGNYEKGKTMQEVWKWLYGLDGKCVNSGKRLFLEADHKTPREHFLKANLDVKKADVLDNFQLLSKRENVIKRGSHKLGGLSFAPAAAVMIYILLRFKPTTYYKFVKMCRDHGLTMADIRFQEGWAFAVWLSKDGKYTIEGDPTPFINEATTVSGEEGENDEE